MPSAPLPLPSPPTVQVIAPDTVLFIECSTDYYNRVQSLLGFVTGSRNRAELLSAQQQIQSQTTVAGTWEDHYLTLLMFLKDFQDKARAAGKFRDATPAEQAEMFGLPEATGSPAPGLPATAPEPARQFVLAA